jgi:hypothetical protein
MLRSTITSRTLKLKTLSSSKGKKENVLDHIEPMSYSYNRVLQWKVKYRCISHTLDDTRETPCTKMPSSEAVNAYGLSQYMVQPSSLYLPLEPPSALLGEREELPAHS